MKEQREILTVREAAAHLRVTENHLTGLARKGQIPAFKVGGQWRFRVDTLEAWATAQEEEGLGKKSRADRALTQAGAAPRQRPSTRSA